MAISSVPFEFTLKASMAIAKLIVPASILFGEIAVFRMMSIGDEVARSLRTRTDSVAGSILLSGSVLEVIAR